MKARYAIPEFNVDRLREAVESLNKRAARLKMPPVTMTLADRREVAYKTPGGLDRVRVVFDIDLEGTDPVLGGWTFEATLDHVSEAGVILKTVPGVELPEAYRTWPPTCDHCGTERVRKETFVLRHAEGRRTVVGRNCLADFLGHVDPHAVAAMCESLSSLAVTAAALDEDEVGYGYHVPRFEGTVTVLSVAAAVIDKFGWLSRKGYVPGGPPATADLVGNYLVSRDGEEEMRKDGVVPEPRHRELAAAAIEWARGLRAAREAEGRSLSDYEHNLAVVLADEVVAVRFFGIAVSVIPTYKRVLGEEVARREARLASHHFGTVGKREAWTLKLTGEHVTEGAYGTTHIYKWVSPEGNRATWFSSRNLDLAIGMVYRVRGTVKRHEAYKGVPETHLTRCTIEATLAPAEGPAAAA